MDERIVELRSEAVQQPGQEGEESLIRRFNAHQFAAVLFVVRPEQLDSLGRPVVVEGAQELAESDRVVELLVEARQGERGVRTHVPLERQVELVGLQRTKSGVAAVGGEQEVVAGHVRRGVRCGWRIVDDVWRVRRSVDNRRVNRDGIAQIAEIRP